VLDAARWAPNAGNRRLQRFVAVQDPLTLRLLRMVSPGMFQRPGSGFLGSALTTAAGVAGGLVAGNALMSLFSGSHGMGGGFGGGFGGSPMVGSPWSTPAATDQGYVDQGTWDNTGGVAGGGQTDPGYVDQGTWDNTGTDQSSWTDNSSDSGFDTGGGGGGSDDSLI